MTGTRDTVARQTRLPGPHRLRALWLDYPCAILALRLRLNQVPWLVGIWRLNLVGSALTKTSQHCGSTRGTQLSFAPSGTLVSTAARSPELVERQPQPLDAHHGRPRIPREQQTEVSWQLKPRVLCIRSVREYRSARTPLLTWPGFRSTPWLISHSQSRSSELGPQRSSSCSGKYWSHWLRSTNTNNPAFVGTKGISRRRSAPAAMRYAEVSRWRYLTK